MRIHIIPACLTLILITGTALAQNPVPDYRIGVDDVLAISVWDNKDLDQGVFVRPDGKISLPLLGEVRAGGLTVAELARNLSEAYSKTVRNAEVMVAIREIRSRPVYFVGGINRVLQLTQELTLLQGIALAGGLPQGSDLESAFILRSERVTPIDFTKLVQKRDFSQNIKLEPGDTVVVPVADMVYIQGEVRSPGAMKFTKDLTMVKAVTQAGGFTPLAAAKRVTVLRGEGPKRDNMRVNVQAMMTDPEDTADIQLRPNDIIIVPQRLF